MYGNSVGRAHAFFTCLKFGIAIERHAGDPIYEAFLVCFERLVACGVCVCAGYEEREIDRDYGDVSSCWGWRGF